MKKFLASVGAGVAVLAMSVVTQADTVTFTATGTVSTLEQDPQARGIDGITGVGQEATVRWTWDTDVVQGELGGPGFTINNAFQAFDLIIGGETYNLNNDLGATGENSLSASGGQSADEPILILFDTGLYQINEADTDRGLIGLAGIDASLSYPSGSITSLAPEDIASDVLTSASIGFSLLTSTQDPDVPPNVRLVIDVDDIAFGSQPVVPTPAALGGAALLVPMLLKRRRSL